MRRRAWWRHRLFPACSARVKMAEGGAADVETQRGEIATLLKTPLRRADTWWDARDDESRQTRALWRTRAVIRDHANQTIGQSVLIWCHFLQVSGGQSLVQAVEEVCGLRQLGQVPDGWAERVPGTGGQPRAAQRCVPPSITSLTSLYHSLPP